MRWSCAVLVLALVVTSRLEHAASTQEAHRTQYRAPCSSAPVHAAKRVAPSAAETRRHAAVALAAAPPPPRFAVAAPVRPGFVAGAAQPARAIELAPRSRRLARGPPRA